MYFHFPVREISHSVNDFSASDINLDTEQEEGMKNNILGILQELERSK